MALTENIERHFNVLLKAPRPAGFNENAAEYLTAQLREMGYGVSTHEVPFTAWRNVVPPSLSLNGETVPCLPLIRSCSGDLKGVLGDPEDWSNYDDQYGWVRWPILQQERVEGYLLSHPTRTFQHVLDTRSDVPYFMAGPKTYLHIKGMDTPVAVEGSVENEFFDDKRLRNIVTQNQTAGRIVVCAHYDTMPQTVGASDNTSGVVCALELARSLKDTDNVQFVFFDGEEYNKHGSHAYVRNLSPPEFDSISLVVTIDNIAAGELYHMRSDSAEVAIDLPRNELTGTSDHWPFHLRGVPVLRLGAAPNIYAHRPEDDRSNVDVSKIERCYELVRDLIPK